MDNQTFKQSPLIFFWEGCVKMKYKCLSMGYIPFNVEEGKNEVFK